MIPHHRPTLFCMIWMLATLTMLTTLARAAGPLVSESSLLDEMTDRDAAARFPDPAYTCRQASSYDRASVSPADAASWMANNDRSFFVRAETIRGRRESVMLDADGPGCIVRFWATSGNPTGNIRVYLDGSDRPAINQPAKTLVGGNALVGPPLSEVCARGMNLYLPIAYAKHCKITYDRPNFHQTKNGDDLLYYQINYRTYEPGTDVQSYAPGVLDALKDKIARLQQTLLDPERTVSQDVDWLDAADETLGPGGTLRLQRSGGGAIRKLMVRVKAKDLPAATRSLLLTLSFDGQRTVNCPVGDFFGSGVGVNPYTGWWRKVDQQGWMACYWVMPYQRSCRVTLTNHGQPPIDAAVKVAVGPWTWDDRSMYFHTNWRQQYPIDTATKHDWNYVQIQGQGVYMGDTLCVVNPVKAWWGEGDEKIYVDGEAFPSHFGTGTEDYYGYAWCTPEFFQSPFHSQPRAEGPGNFGQVTNTRVRLLDGIPFHKSLRFDMEVWHWAQVQEAYAATTYWYGRPGAKGNWQPTPEQLRVIHVERPKPRKVQGALEGEQLKRTHRTGGKIEIQSGDQFKWSDNKQLWWIDARPGDTLELELPVATSEMYRLQANLTRAVDYGIVRFALDGKPLGKPIDLYHNGVSSQVYTLGTRELTAGKHRLAIEIAGANPKAVKRHMFGLDYLKLERVE